MSHIDRYEIDPASAKATFKFNATVSAIAGGVLAFAVGLGWLMILGLALIAGLCIPSIFSLLTKPYRFQALEITDTALVVESKSECKTHSWDSIESMVRHVQKTEPYLILHFKGGEKPTKRMLKLEGLEPENIDALFLALETHFGQPIKTVKI